MSRDNYEISLTLLKEDERVEIGKVVALVNGRRYYLEKKGQPNLDHKTEENLISTMYNIIRETPEKSLVFKIL